MKKKLTELFSGIDCRFHGDAEHTVISGVEYNSKKVSSGSLFFCLVGARSDGHDFAMQAYELGCRAFVVEHLLPLPEDSVQVTVSSSRETLAYVSADFYSRPADKLTVIGVTGTKGKTTTAIMIEETLMMCGVKCAYIGSNGVIIGKKHFDTINSTPESRELHKYFALMLEMGFTHIVMEVSSQALDNCRVLGINFDTVIYTNLSPDHIGKGEHATFEEYRDAKRKLFTDYGAKNLIFNSDDGHAEYMMSGARGNIITYGIDSDADYVASDDELYRDSTSLGVDFELTQEGVKHSVSLRTPGHFSIYNALAALACVTCYGIHLDSAISALKHISVKGRFEIVEALDGITCIIDYAHNGLSLTNALSTLREYEPRKLTCLFGCVGGRTYLRRRELAEVSGKLADFTIISSDNPDFENEEDIIKDVLGYFDKSKPYITIADREEAIRFALRTARDGDIILFAGKGHENYQLIDGEKVPFSEKKIILNEAEHIRAEMKSVTV